MKEVYCTFLFDGTVHKGIDVMVDPLFKTFMHDFEKVTRHQAIDCSFNFIMRMY